MILANKLNTLFDVIGFLRKIISWGRKLCNSGSVTVNVNILLVIVIWILLRLVAFISCHLDDILNVHALLCPDNIALGAPPCLPVPHAHIIHPIDPDPLLVCLTVH